MHKTMFIIATIFVFLAIACDKNDSAGQTTQTSTAVVKKQNTPKDWDPQAVLAAITFQGEAFIHPQINVIEYRSWENSSHNVRINEALVIFSGKTVTAPLWRLARVFNRPLDRMPSPKLELWNHLDKPFINARDYPHPPTQQEINLFIADCEWNNTDEYKGYSASR